MIEPYPIPILQLLDVDISYLREWEKEREEMVRLRDEILEAKRENEQVGVSTEE